MLYFRFTAIPEKIITQVDGAICPLSLLGICEKEDRCEKSHKRMPYCWQYKIPGINDPWMDTEQEMNRHIEKAYADPQNDTWRTDVQNWLV